MTLPVYRSRWVILAAAVGMVALTVSLGRWQLDRAGQKEALLAMQQAQATQPELDLGLLHPARTDTQAFFYRPVRATGRWVSEHTVFLDNRQMDGRPGFYVVTPLLLEPGSHAVLVQRGWVPRDPLDRTRLPTWTDATGPVLVTGRMAPAPAQLYDFAPGEGGRIRQNIDLAAFSAESGLTLWPASIQQGVPEVPGVSGDPVRRDWPVPAADVHKHYGYAAQWFGLAALTLVLYVWFQVIRPRLTRLPR